MTIIRKCAIKENHPGESFNVEAIGGLECGKCHY